MDLFLIFFLKLWFLFFLLLGTGNGMSINIFIKILFVLKSWIFWEKIEIGLFFLRSVWRLERNPYNNWYRSASMIIISHLKAYKCWGSGSTRIRIKKGLENLQVHSVNTEQDDQSKDPFEILKIIFCLLIFNDFLMSFWKILVDNFLV